MASRGVAYRTCLYDGLDVDELATIRVHLQQECVLGDRQFEAMVEEALGRPAQVRRPGRPTAVVDA